MWRFNICVLVLMLVFITTDRVVAQQVTALSTYTYNMITINPAYSGYSQTMDLSLAAGTSIPYIEGAPQTGNFTINGPASSYYDNMGIGGGVSVDKLGVTTTTDVYMTYAYKLISRNRNSYTNWGFYPNVLSFGLQVGMSYVHEDLMSLGITDDPDFSGNVEETIPYFGFGMFYSKNHFYVGLSVPRMYHSFLHKDGEYNLSNHYYFQSGYKSALNERTNLKTALLVRYVEGAPVQFDANCIFEFSHVLEAGAGYRSAKGIHLLTGVHIGKKMRLIYYYDMILHKNAPSQLENTNGILLSIRPSGNFEY